MARVVIDPDEVRHFARELSRSAETLREGRSHLVGSFRELRDVWHDTKYEQFDRVFSEAVDHLELFFHDAEVYADYLRRKAQKADRFLEGGY